MGPQTPKLSQKIVCGIVCQIFEGLFCNNYTFLHFTEKEIKDEDPVDETAEASDGEADDAKDSEAKDEKTDNKESSEQTN